jgi:hypothetical protein
MSNYHQHLLSGKEPTDIKQFVLDPNFYNQSLPGFYRGIVLQNNDPERRGRVKIFIPAFSPHIYDQWLRGTKEEGQDEVNFTNKKFRFSQGSNINKVDCTDEDRPSLKQIAEEAKKVLEWAEQASCLFGSGSSGLYGLEEDKCTISDASTSERFPAANNAQCAKQASAGSVNVDNTGEKGGYKFEIDSPETDLQDGYVSLNEDKMPDVNAFAKTYKPSTYSNKTKGIFTVPNVGATVWVFFENGDVMRPVYFAYSYDKRDWQSIYEVGANNGPDYPGAFENTVNSADNQKIKKGKTVFNSKAGAIEFIDTDEFEQIKITQAGGSFIQLSNKAAVYYVDKNEQKLVSGDQFETVNQVKNLRVKKGYNIGIDESRWTRIGFWNADAYNGWKEENRIIADTRARFAIKRATVQPSTSISLPAGSIKQEQAGKFASNPVLSDITTAITSPAINQVYNQIPASSTAKGNQCSTLETATNSVQGNSSMAANVSPSSEEFQQAAGANGSNNFSGDPAKSSSTENGSWDFDNDYAAINDLETKQASKMLEFETKFGNGGDDLTEITRHKIEIIGAAFNDAPSVRVDAVGRSNFNEVLVGTKGAFASRKPSSLVERVANDGKFPCGNYTLVIGNTLSVSSGAGGIKLMTTGCTDICGSQILVAGSNELLLSSGGDINVTSQGKFSVTADIITFRQSNGKQVAIDGSLGVNNNLVVAGGAYIEGELCINHITAPVEIQETETMQLFGSTRIEPNQFIVGYVYADQGGDSPDWRPVYSAVVKDGTLLQSTPDCIINVPHSHNFKNIPLTLKQNNEGVRTAASAMNKGSNRLPASPIRNGMKQLS